MTLIRILKTQVLSNHKRGNKDCFNFDEFWKCYAKWINETKNFIYPMITFTVYEMSEICKSIETESRLVRKGGFRVIVIDMEWSFFMGDENIQG